MRRLLLVSLLFNASLFAADDARWSAVAEALGRQGALQADGVYKVGFLGPTLP